MGKSRSKNVSIDIAIDIIESKISRNLALLLFHGYAAYAESYAAYAECYAAYAESYAAYAVGCAAYAESYAAYVRQCENKAKPVQLSWSWD